MPWFVKIERGIVDKTRFDQFVPAHRCYVQQLIDQGRRATTGYWGDYGGGMLLFQADSLTDALAIAQADPLIANHCVEYEVHEWRIVVTPPQGITLQG
ncbi:MAG: YciI family protein [Synechocystis sp.]|nr:YciI family protein [Synechocystis sp.]